MLGRAGPGLDSAAKSDGIRCVARCRVPLNDVALMLRTPDDKKRNNQGTQGPL